MAYPAKLEKIISTVGTSAHGGKKSPYVIFPLATWIKIEDVLAESLSPRLRRSIMEARRDFQVGKGIPYLEARKSFKRA